MKRIVPLISLLLFFCPINSFAYTISSNIDNDGNILEMVSTLGPFQVAMSSSYIYMDMMAAPYDIEESSCADAKVNTCFLSLIDYEALEPDLLISNHEPYFISVPSEGRVNFSVLYYDEFCNNPAGGYPNVSYWPINNPASSATIVMTYVSTISSEGNICMLYASTVTLASGLYEYEYKVMNEFTPEEYSLGLSSFAVTERPESFLNTGLSAGAMVSNGKVRFSWSAADPEGGNLTFKLYCGKTEPGMGIVYEGANTSCEILGLDPSQDYFWQVECLDQYGASLRSPVFRFTTISQVQKAYNYPNPFNPVRQPTSIVYTMEEAGNMNIKVYTELGDLCWQKSAVNLPQGVNEEPFYGRDDNGNILYNGTYVCMIEKNYSTRSQRENCRLLIVK